MVDEREFEELTPHLTGTRRTQILPPLQKAMQEADITSGLREAHAMAQFLHESGGFQFKRELASGNAYEGRLDLGNTDKGDGPRYKGRGWIQITGRSNYRRFGAALGLDLENEPELAETYENASRLACAFWTSRGLNSFADRDDILTITRRINGGVNGLADRRSQLNLAKRILSVNDPLDLQDQEEPFRLLHNDKEISFDAFQDSDNTMWAPLRIMTDTFEWTIINIDAHDAHINREGTEASLTLVIRGTRGFSPIRKFAEISGLNINFDAQNRAVQLIG